MCRNGVGVAVLALMLLALPAPGGAATAPEDLFRQGVAASREGELEEAIRYFEAAREQGLDTGALHYNLGVTYYLAGRLADAEAAFQRAADSDAMVAPALYQLGRLARERGDTQRAQGFFRRSASAARTQALAERARMAWRELATVIPPSFVYFSGGGGYDSNLSLTPDDAGGVSEESGLFVEGLALIRRPFSGPNYLRGSVYAQEFTDESDFDLISLRGGIGRVGPLADDWRWDAYGDGRHRRFGGDTLDNALLLGVGLETRVRGWWLNADYRFEGTRGGSDFEFLDGISHELELRLDQAGRVGWRLSASGGTTDSDDRDTGDDFFSFSYDEFQLEAEYAWLVRSRTRLILGGDWRHRRYDGNEVRDGTVLDEREDDRFGVGVAAAHRFTERWRGELSARLEERDSNVAEFDYQREVIRLQLDRRF